MAFTLLLEIKGADLCHSTAMAVESTEASLPRQMSALI